MPTARRVILLAAIAAATIAAACATPTEPTVQRGAHLFASPDLLDGTTGKHDSLPPDTTEKPHDQLIWW